MSEAQKVIKYIAIALAVVLIVAIFSGILTVLSALTYIVSPESDSSNIYATREFIISSDITKLEIELYATELFIETGDEFKVETNNGDLIVEESNFALKIKDVKNFIDFDKNSYTVTICIPSNLNFSSVSLKAGASKVDIFSLFCDTLKLELGAGVITMSGITVEKEANIDGGAGKLEIQDSVITDLTLSIGVGEADIDAALNGENKLECGIGEAKMTLIGSSNDYSISVSKGLGDVLINGKQMQNDQVYGTGEAELSVECGVGNVNIDFK